MSLRRCSIIIFLGILVIMPVFSPMMSAQLPAIVQEILPLMMLVFAILFSMDGRKIVISKNIDKFYVAWFLFLLIALLGTKRNVLGTIRIFSCILLPHLIKRRCEWIKNVCYIFGAVLGINVLFTFFFFLFPQYYNIIISIYGYVPSGTSGGTAGYRAGIANHYSQNGIYISVFLMMLTILFIAKVSFDKKKQKKSIELFLIILTSIALLLTGKRGVIIWSVLAIILTFLLSGKEKIGKITKLMVIALFGLGCLQILSETVPAISYVFERFQTIGEDTASMERLAMWDLALEKFKDNPIFGNGFWSYKSFYANNLAGYWHPNVERYKYLNAHNVYIQVLCEMGIVGELIYLAAIGLMLLQTIKIVKNIHLLDSVELRFGAMFSLCIQIYYCLYSLTGSCLYDIVFYFYALAAAMTLAINNEMHKKGLI